MGVIKTAVGVAAGIALAYFGYLAISTISQADTHHAKAVAQVFTDTDAEELDAIRERISQARTELLSTIRSYNDYKIGFCLSLKLVNLTELQIEVHHTAMLILVRNRMKTSEDTVILNQFLRLQIEAFLKLLPLERDSVNFSSCGSEVVASQAHLALALLHDTESILSKFYSRF